MSSRSFGYLHQLIFFKHNWLHCVRVWFVIHKSSLFATMVYPSQHMFNMCVLVVLMMIVSLPSWRSDYFSFAESPTYRMILLCTRLVNDSWFFNRFNHDTLDEMTDSITIHWPHPSTQSRLSSPIVILWTTQLTTRFNICSSNPLETYFIQSKMELPVQLPKSKCHL